MNTNNLEATRRGSLTRGTLTACLLFLFFFAGTATVSAQSWKTPAQAQVILKTEYVTMEQDAVMLQETDPTAHQYLLAKMKLYSDVHFETRQTNSVDEALQAAIAKHVSSNTVFGTDGGSAGGSDARSMYAELKALLTD